jgi:succinate dehydrogenase hydrophobic anchor subunit
MWKRIAQSIAGLILTVLALWVVFALAMRAKFPPVLTAIRRINRVVTNREQWRQPVGREPMHR